MIRENIYVAINKDDEIQYVCGSSSKTRYFRTDKYLKNAVENHNKYHPDDEWEVRRCVVAEDTETRWIPVSERLPEDCEDVIVCAERNAYTEDGTIRNRVIEVGFQVEGRWHIDGCSGVDGLAWMPLPELYNS